MTSGPRQQSAPDVVPLPTAEELARWPGAERREPPLSHRSYLMREALARSIAASVDRVFPDRDDLSVLDVGCADKPYLPLVAHRAASYRGIDSQPDPGVDDVGTADALPYPAASFDLVLCTQVLEHVPDPAATVAEIARVLKPGGAALMSTHGVYIFHPDPPGSGQDYWRWTHAGLERLVAANGDWASIEVEPHREVLACLATIGLWYLDHLLERVAPGAVRRAVVAFLNRVAELLDDRFPANLRTPAPGALPVNYLVTAVRESA